MSISTGDPSRSTPKKSTTPEAADDDSAANDGPVGGVLPVKKAVRPASGGRSGSGSNSRTGSNGNGASAAKATPAKASAAKAAAPAKSTPAKVTAASTSATKVTAAGTSATKATAAKAAPAKSTPAKSTAAKSTSALTGRGAGGAKGRRPIAPVRVAEKRNWGSIALLVGTGVVALLIIGYSVWPLVKDSFLPSWKEKAAAIPGIINYIDPASPNYIEAAAQANHQPGDLSYAMSPPAGGNHNTYWQACTGIVYTAQIADEHAVHALEHGAVWITYSPDLPQDQIDSLANRVRDRNFIMMSPYPGLEAANPITLEAWGYQLKAPNASDGRIDDFIEALRQNASLEPQAGCSGGITDTGALPVDLGGGM